AALLLAYLEDKFNLLLQSKEKNKGWMLLNKFQVQNAIFAESYHYVEQGLEQLMILNFIQLNPKNADYPRQENEIWVKVDALKINQWLSIYKKSDEVRMNLLNFNPFLALMLFGKSEPEVIEKIVEKKVIEREKFKESDLPFMRRASRIYEFWKWVTNHPQSKISEKFLKMIIARLKEDYTDGQLAHSIYGLLPRKENPEMNKFDGIKYVFGDSEKVDRMISDAIKSGYTEKLAEDEFDDFCQALEHQEDIKPRPIRYGSKNKSTGANLV
ncbi:MAG: hypothetical protein WBP82_12095, partial [Leuconostoc mesenteroides]